MKKKIAIVLGVIFVILVLAVVMNPFLIVVPLMAMGKIEGMRVASPLADAHERAVTTFVNSEGFGVGRFRKAGLWNESTVLFQGQEYDRVEIRLIGLTPEYGPRHFSHDEPPVKESLSGADHRDLDPAEAEAVRDLVKGQNQFVELPVDSVEESFTNRVFAPIVMRAECADCHSAEVGTVLGAFDYRLSLRQQ